MNWTAVGAIGQWFAGIATLGVVVYAIWHDRFQRPKLLLTFANDRDVKSQSATVGLDPRVLSRWLRVMVQNAPGRRVAKSCRAFLVGIERVAPDGFLADVFPNDARALAWMHDPTQKPSPLDLLPGIRHWVDVAAAIDGQAALSVRVQPPWALDQPGDYLFTIQVSAEDADPALIKVCVHWNGTWQSLRGDVDAA